MRVNLNTGFAEHKEAKALGAKWDSVRRVWFVIDPPDLTPFMRWIPSEQLTQKSETQEVKKARKPAITKSAPVPHCGCNALPWDDCEHTAH